MHLRNISAGLVQALLQKYGRRIVPFHVSQVPGLRLRELLQRFNINLFLDVGANEGQTGIQLRESGYERDIVSFEPQSLAFAKLRARAERDPHWHVRQLALGEQETQARINTSAFSPSSSFLSMTARHTAIVADSGYTGTELVKMTTLDSATSEFLVQPKNIFLKLDVQGYEAIVLRGATTLLPSVRAAKIETLFVNLYENQAKYYELFGLMDQYGFDLTGLDGCTYDQTTGDLLWGDAFFVHRCEVKARSAPESEEG